MGYWSAPPSTAIPSTAEPTVLLLTFLGLWMMVNRLPVSEWNLNRFVVMVSAIALIVISALGLWHGGSTAHMVVNAVILAFAVLGFLGACVEDVRWLQLYLLLTVVLFIWELVYILVSAFRYDMGAKQLGWDIALCVLLALSASCTATLLRGGPVMRSTSSVY